MNAHSSYSQTGQASTTPTVTPTFIRSVNWSKAPVPSSVQEPSAVNTARDESGSEQYGDLSSSPRLGQPNSAVPNQMQPKTVVMARAISATVSRLRSS